MNIRLVFSPAFLLLFSVFASAQDTVAEVQDSGQWFSDTSPAVSKDTAEEKKIAGGPAGADTITLADRDSAYTVVVTATRREQPSEWVSDDHVEIDVNKVSRNTSKTVAELLETAVPARMSDMGGGTVKNISLTGAGSERTLVLVDGKRMGVTDGDVGDLSPEMIEKIEIVEGGQSALYGMDAVGGVVNIITRRPPSARPFGSLSMTASSFEPHTGRPGLNAMKHNFTTGMNNGLIGWIGGAEWQSSDGRFTYKEVNNTLRFRENNGFSNWRMFQQVRYGGDPVSLGLSASYCDRAIGTPGAVTYGSMAAEMKKKIGFIAADGSWTVNEHLKIRLNAFYARDSIHYADPNPYWPQDSRHVWSKRDVECVQEFTLQGQMVNTGVQVLNQSVISNEMGCHGALQGSIFANGILKKQISDFVIRATPAVRFDYSSVFKGTLNGKFGLMATLDRTVKPSVFVNAGSSYQSPPFTYLYWPQDAYAVGNPDLKPEKSGDVDAGVQLEGAVRGVNVTARSSFFSLLLSDMLLWQPRQADSTDSIWTIKNIDRASITGAKIGVNFRASEFLAGSAGFVYHDARNRNSDAVLIYRPKYILTASGRTEWKRLTAGISCRFTSEVFTNEANTRHLPPAWTFDASAGYTVLSLGGGRGIRLVYDVLNLSNVLRSTNEGYPLPGREHRLSLKAGF